MDTPTTAVGPGLGAFVAFFVLALILWFLMRNMNGRMRRMAYAERDRRERLEAEEAARTGGAEAATAPAPTGAPTAPADPAPAADPAPGADPAPAPGAEAPTTDDPSAPTPGDPR